MKRFLKILLLIFLIIGIGFMIIRNSMFLKLDECAYTSVECSVGYEFRTDNPEKAGRVIDFLNDSRFFKTLKSVDTLASPEFVMMLTKKDGSRETIEIYSGAWEEGLYLKYNDAQYKIKNSDNFFEELEFMLRG